MHQEHTHERDVARDELHMQELGQNIFIITMMGAVAFAAACLAVMLH